MKGMNPRGPVSIDPETRDIVRNIYARKVEAAVSPRTPRRTLEQHDRYFTSPGFRAAGAGGSVRYLITGPC